MVTAEGHDLDRMRMIELFGSWVVMLERDRFHDDEEALELRER